MIDNPDCILFACLPLPHQPSKFDCQLVWMIFIFCQFSQDNVKWPENQILIPDWTYFHCPGANPGLEQGELQISSWPFTFIPNHFTLRKKKSGTLCFLV